MACKGGSRVEDTGFNGNEKKDSVFSDVTLNSYFFVNMARGGCW